MSMKVGDENFNPRGYQLYHAINPYLKKHYNTNKEYYEDISKILKLILETGKIVCRSELKKINEELYDAVGCAHSLNWNGDDRVSVSVSDYEAFSCFPQSFPAIILSTDVMWDGKTKWKTGRKEQMYGEIQFQGPIDASYFLGITLPEIYHNEALESLLENINDVSKEDINYIKSILPEEFIDKHYYREKYIEEVLRETGYGNLGIYDIHTGKKVNSVDEEISLIKKVKKRV